MFVLVEEWWGDRRGLHAKGVGVSPSFLTIFCFNIVI